ncbi:MAG: hypothetical protein Q7J98_04330 [Kiritimatiellia bacterium]|nr:hypothetical protein [Kiritimatiellia bacterium]
MKKLVLITNFLCAYYYYAARDAAKSAVTQKLPESLQNAIVALIMSQCALEGYINYIICKNRIASKIVKVGDPLSPKCKCLDSVSIRDKWAHVPIIVANRYWTMNAAPFKYFAKLVDHRNDLVHFDSDKFTHEVAVPDTIATTGDLMAFTKNGSWLAGSKIDRAMRMGIAGPLIIHDMITGLHQMMGADAPDFLGADKLLYSIKIQRDK